MQKEPTTIYRKTWVCQIVEYEVYWLGLTYSRSNLNSGAAKYLRQGVTITGLQSFTFNKNIYTVAEVHALFSRAVGVDKLEECQVITAYKGMSALELSNRYFTPCKNMVEDDELIYQLIQTHMDILQRLQEQHCAILRRMLSCTSNSRGLMKMITSLVIPIIRRVGITHVPFYTGIYWSNLSYLGLATSLRFMHHLWQFHSSKENSKLQWSRGE